MKSSGPLLLVVLLVALGGGAVAFHDVRSPDESWVLHRFMDLKSSPPPASELPAQPESPPATDDVPPVEATPTPAEPPATGESQKSTALPSMKTPAAMPAASRPVASTRTSTFKPPRTGTALRLKLANGTMMTGKLKTLSETAIELEKDSVTLTLQRSQIAPESRIYFFAADHADYQARKAASTAAAIQPAPLSSPQPSRPVQTAGPSVRPMPTHTPSSTPSPTSPVTTPDTRDTADVFFDAFSK